MRTPHYWKKGGRTTAPSEIVVFDVETWHGSKVEDEHGELQTFRLACGLAYRYEQTRRTRMSRLRTNSPGELWEWIVSRLSSERVVWVWAHNAPYDLGASGLWQHIRSPRFECRKCVLTPSTTWIDGKYDTKRIAFCDTLNFFKCSLAEVGRAVGIRKMTMPDQDEDDESWFEYCMNDVEITAKAVDQLIDFTRTEKLGKWMPTVAGMSFQAYRTRFMTDNILVHCNREVLDMEREAYYGGIVETAFVGKTNVGPIYELDVVSMYPSVCLQSLPTKLKFASTCYGTERLRELSKQFMVIANVEIKTDTETYPVRVKGKTYHATGKFRTSLAHPELMLALDRGHVKWVHHSAFYEHAPIFKTFMEWGFRQRQHYKALGQDGFAILCKYLINGLYGKTGQRSPRWVEWGEEAFRIIEAEHGLEDGALRPYYDWPPASEEHEWPFLVPSLDLALNCRNYWGITEVDCGYSESRDSCPAIAAIVTSYARTLLRSYHEYAGKGNWVYSDTDSIWVNGTGYRNLIANGCIRSGAIGTLDVKGRYDWVIIHGPKDYETPTYSIVATSADEIASVIRQNGTPTSAKLKGVKKDWRPGKHKPYSMLQFPSAMNQLKNPREDGIYVRRVEKELRRIIDRCVVGPDGWTTPITLG